MWDFLKNMYSSPSVRIHDRSSLSNPIPLSKGTRQRFLLSPLLFSIVLCRTPFPPNTTESEACMALGSEKSGVLYSPMTNSSSHIPPGQIFLRSKKHLQAIRLRLKNQLHQKRGTPTEPQNTTCMGIHYPIHHSKRPHYIPRH